MMQTDKLKNYFNKNKAFPLYLQTALILLFAAAAALLQAGGFLSLPHKQQVFFLCCVYLIYFTLLFWLKVTKRLVHENTAVTMMLLLGILLRWSYILLSGLYDRQHDAGVYTGRATDFVNPGHIGYIEYIYKFHKLPDLNPYELFAYYHPPLHHILSSLWLHLNIWLGAAEDLAFENLQVLTFAYSCFCMVITCRILKLLQIRTTGLYIGLAFMVFHPATIIMAGSVNNDMLTLLFMCLTLYFSLRWIREKTLKNMVFLALVIGFGMITKLNSAALAIPLGLVFLLHFLSVLRDRYPDAAAKKACIIKWIKNYAIFAALVCPIGLCWVVRNLIRFREKPGVPVPGETSPMYTAPFSLWSRLGIPALADWHFDFPFHPISAKACNNTWVIMMHTSLFTEEYPADLPDILLSLCQITFFLSVIFALLTALLLVAVLLDKRTLLEDRIFLLTGYIVMLISFAAFVIVYPYTCSSDFRYVAICLVYIAIALGLGNQYYPEAGRPAGKNFLQKAAPLMMHIINGGILTILLLIQIIYVFWERW